MRRRCCLPAVVVCVVTFALSCPFVLRTGCCAVSNVIRNCKQLFKKTNGVCDKGATTRHEFDIVWKDLDFKLRVRGLLPDVDVWA